MVRGMCAPEVCRVMQSECIFNHIAARVNAERRHDRRGRAHASFASVDEALGERHRGRRRTGRR